MMRMNSGFEAGCMGEEGFEQKRYTKTVGVWMYFGMSESLHIYQAFGCG
jgi:hypothetical protein